MNDDAARADAPDGEHLAADATPAADDGATAPDTEDATARGGHADDGSSGDSWVDSGDAVRDDSALLSAHVAGDEDAFGELVRRHRDRMWAVALRTTGDPEDAADALQDAFISAFRNAASFRGEAAVTTWLHRVVVNACLDRMRRRKARPTVPFPEEDGETGQRGIADPRDDLDRLELRLEIDRALAALPDDQRAAIVLVDIEGLPVSDAARLLGVPEGTVKSRCSRGRARLAVALAGLRNPDAPSHVTPPRRPSGASPSTTATSTTPTSDREVTP
jgi:RNA polymerase sigma-70 factor (ECF subfamily)